MTFVLIVFRLEKGETFSSAGDTEELDEILVVESRDDTEELFCRLRNTCCKGIRVKDIDLSLHRLGIYLWRSVALLVRCLADGYISWLCVGAEVDFTELTLLRRYNCVHCPASRRG